MSNERCIVFFGIRLPLDEIEVELCEIRRHPLMIDARDEGLQHYWGDFGESEERYFLFVGKRIGILGRENDNEIQIGSDELEAIVTFTTARLAKAQIQGVPRFFVQREPAKN